MGNKKLIFLSTFSLMVMQHQAQSCSFSGKNKIINFFEKNKVFKETKSELGTFGLGFDLLNCERIGDTCQLDFRLFYAPAEKPNSIKPQCEVILCVRKKSKYYPQQVINKTTILKQEKIKFISKPNTYIVFYSKGITSFAICTTDFK